MKSKEMFRFLLEIAGLALTIILINLYFYDKIGNWRYIGLIGFGIIGWKWRIGW